MNRILARATAALALFGAGLLLTACGNGAYGDNASTAGAQPASTTRSLPPQTPALWSRAARSSARWESH